MAHTLKPARPNIQFPQLEEEVLSYWKKNKIFEKSIDRRPESKTWTFLDGPPFITGLPHYGTLLVSIPKDLFPRYYTMKGYRVRRVWGWDVHGLPAENKVEVKLGIKRKKDIEEKVGVGKFIEECKKYVSESSKEWEWYVDHVGRWVDFAHAYKTMDLSYMETVMWVFKKMYEKNHIYKGLRISLYCPHCATPISNFEVAMDQENYKEIAEQATTYKYALADEPGTYILAWSTTPWNKLATPALAVNPKLTYVKVRQGEESYILAESTVFRLTDVPYTVTETFTGKDLIGKTFVPHYQFYAIDPKKRAFVIIPGEFVTAEEGTGVVTIAAYGEEDLAVIQKENIQIVLHVDEEGKLKPEVPKWGGMYYLDVNPLVNEDLKSRGLVYRDETITHSVPTCWRCHTRLLFAPQNAWYVDVQNLKKQLLKTNESVHWFPGHFKHGRYQKSIESAPDWCISRSRYWGSPVPVWECPCGERFVPGSIKELEEASGMTITDLHKPGIDEVIVPCRKCGKTCHRVPEVLDSWIEAGSASLAERHYPFDKSHNLQDFFPPDFIVEYTGQIRAWFYVLHVVATAVFGTEAFKNVLVHGTVLGTDGRKMSKNFGNYPDPKELIQKYGGDALRLYLMGSTVMHGEDMIISEEQYRDKIRGFLLLLWNIYNFFLLYAVADHWNPGGRKQEGKESVLDRWIQSKGQTALASVTKSLDAFDTVASIQTLQQFIEDFSLWYVRRSRSRIGPTAVDVEEKNVCYRTLYDTLVLLCRMLAPITPFLSEEMYRNLTGEESVHLSDWPVGDSAKIDAVLEEEMREVRNIVEKIHSKRKELGIPVRQGLSKARISNYPIIQLSNELQQLIKEETNIRNIVFDESKEGMIVELDTTLTKELEQEGKVREVIRTIQKLRKENGCAIGDCITLTLPQTDQGLDEALLERIKRETLAATIVWGTSLTISTSD